ncbi:glyoxalase/bleomycin resistance/extradiol dioxygenase family protein [Rhodohalobacter sp. SW132]|uniref:VOC family protein n=1 Tax=Rhodohalobacter sp. SW132 TaxID=2293433 RepID=UPI000E28495F|nr:VOC family protein [Rhodohalobacter sp. SW132]REL33688.1 glyoxalase/bleomycin resistance/extradiol dioxygenase family protein [Rhodohalobacter sp. SW132]
MKITETCLYADDLEKAESFYSGVMKFDLIQKEKQRHLFYRCENGMLLIFDPNSTLRESSDGSKNPVPRHGATGSGHIAFTVSPENYSNWKGRLQKQNIEIESEIKWPGGSESFYFRDPSGNSLEIIKGDMWDLN